MGAEVFEGRFRLRFGGRAHPIELAGVLQVCRGHHGWGSHALELRGEMVLRTTIDRSPLPGFARRPVVWEQRTPVPWLISPRSCGRPAEE